ncbi:Heat shock 70 kDa protein 12A, partial [Lunasporangiospora selenospora]
PKQTHSYPKVPTCNLYGPNSKEILEWGYPAKLALSKPPFKNHVLLSKYKLHLDDSSGPHPPLPNGLTVVDAIADYLRLFHAHSVLKGFGASYEQRHIQYCLSVPAMWSDTAKAVMRQAALQAGMISPLDPPHRLLLISEPEAAALYCEKKCDQFSIGHGQRFMICDAGGGTVDLIVFEVAVGPNGRTLREVTRGSGHSCGSVFLDERMEALLRRRMSKWQEKGPTPTNWAQIMDHFIHSVKPLFDGLEDQYIPLPAIPGRSDLTDYDIGLEDGVLTIKAEEMRRDVFDPVVDDVLRLIQHQLQQTRFNCHAIFMVGGFGCSNYLHQRVTAEFGSQVPLIGVPPRAELAVVRGAVYAGLTPRMVTQRVARRWYGVDSLMSYEEGSDMPHKKFRDREGVIRARDRFSVYVAPGQTIGMDECITKRYITYQYPKPVNSPLYACSYMTLPRYVDSPSVEKIGDFTIPLPYVPGAQPGHKMVFELRMYFGLTEIRAEAEINGKVVSTRCQFSG